MRSCNWYFLSERGEKERGEREERGEKKEEMLTW